jgi:hypothetical protein
LLAVGRYQERFLVLSRIDSDNAQKVETEAQAPHEERETAAYHCRVQLKAKRIMHLQALISFANLKQKMSCRSSEDTYLSPSQINHALRCGRALLEVEQVIALQNISHEAISFVRAQCSQTNLQAKDTSLHGSEIWHTNTVKLAPSSSSLDGRA